MADLDLPAPALLACVKAQIDPADIVEWTVERQVHRFSYKVRLRSKAETVSCEFVVTDEEIQRAD